MPSRRMQPIATDVVWSVCVCVNVSVGHTGKSAKTTELIKVLFRLCTQVDPRKHY